MYARIRRAREDRGYTREAFAEQLDVSVSYLAEVERGRTRISVKMLTQISRVLGLSADYILLGEEATSDRMLLSSIRRIDKKYHPLLNKLITELLALSAREEVSV